MTSNPLSNIPEPPVSASVIDPILSINNLPQIQPSIKMIKALSNSIKLKIEDSVLVLNKRLPFLLIFQIKIILNQQSIIFSLSQIMDTPLEISTKIL